MSMSKIDDGGPAFAYVPNQQQMLPNGTWDQSTDFGEPGMSVRMYAAIHLMPVVWNGACKRSDQIHKPRASDWDVARESLNLADALIAAEKEGR